MSGSRSGWPARSGTVVRGHQSAGNDPRCTAAVDAGAHVHAEHASEALSPAHRTALRCGAALLDLPADLCRIPFDMRGPVAPRRLQPIAHPALRRDRQPFLRDRRARDVAAQAFELVAFGFFLGAAAPGCVGLGFSRQRLAAGLALLGRRPASRWCRPFASRVETRLSLPSASALDPMPTGRCVTSR